MAKIGKTLKNFLYALPIAAASVFLQGCEKENYPPVAKLEVSPLSGEVPLPVRMKVTGTDENGPKDIHWYDLNINNQKIRRKYPIDTTMTFPESGIYKIYGEVIDSKNQRDITETSSIEVYGKPFIEQSANLSDEINIKYDATLFRVPEADLTITKDGSSFSTKKISDINQTGEDYQKTFTNSSDGITKGEYEFTLKSGSLEKKSSVEVPNYNPTISSLIPVDFLEETDTTITLPTPTDKNPEDNPVAYQSATSLDGKTQVTLLTGNKLKIEGISNQTGNYSIELEFGSSAGGLEKAVLTGNLIDDPRIKVNPFVQPNDTTKPIIWNNFKTINERNAYFDDRLYNYDKTDTITYIPDKFVCTGFASQWAINFNGYGELGFDPEKGLQNNGWHNIPAYTVTLMKPSPFHQITAVMIKDIIAEINNWRFIEPQTDSTYTLSKFNDAGVYKIVLNYTYVLNSPSQGKILDNIPMFEFIPDGSGGWKDSGYRNPDINLIEQRGK